MWVTMSWLSLAGAESITWGSLHAMGAMACDGQAIPISLQRWWVPGKGSAHVTVVLALSVGEDMNKVNKHNLINTFLCFLLHNRLLLK